MTIATFPQLESTNLITTLNRQNKVVKLQIWYIAGQVRFRANTNEYYRGADGILLVFGVTDPSIVFFLIPPGGYWI